MLSTVQLLHRNIFSSFCPICEMPVAVGSVRQRNRNSNLRNIVPSVQYSCSSMAPQNLRPRCLLSLQAYDPDNQSRALSAGFALGRSIPFPRRLHAMIQREAVQHPSIVRWSGDGRAFFVDNEDAFIKVILPQYGFKASKMQSFQVRACAQCLYFE